MQLFPAFLHCSLTVLVQAGIEHRKIVYETKMQEIAAVNI